MQFSQRNLSLLVTPLQHALDTAHSLLVIKRVSEAFKQLAHGITSNPSVTVASLLVYAHKIISSVLLVDINTKERIRTSESDDQEMMARTSARPLSRLKADVIGIVSSKGSVTDNNKGVLTKNGNRDIVLRFGLQLVLFGLKHKKLKLQSIDELYEVSVLSDTKEAPSSVDNAYTHTHTHTYTNTHTHTSHTSVSVSVLQMLDPYVSLLRECVKPSRCLSNRVIRSIIKCLCYLFRCDLPSLHTHIPALSHFLFRTIEHGNAEASQSCMHAVAIAITHCTHMQVTEEQLRMLLVRVKHSIVHASAHRTVSLMLLKAVLSRKLLVSEVYDTMKEVQTLLIHTHLTHIQTRCSSLLMRFLLDYPLSPKRLQQHFNFLMNNLTNYAYAQGRSAVVNVLMVLFRQLPTGMCVCVCVCVLNK